jgi:exodeoxyribonuclease VII large subunit
VIGVVTSPSGAVIRDILHRLRDRFPRHVLIWPVAVQGRRTAPPRWRRRSGGSTPCPGRADPAPRSADRGARGGGSLEDLWGFNEEIVVRAAAASAIPLISAVGHETDTTLIDFAADRRAPTPTAAAEMAVPVRLELLAVGLGVSQRRQRLRDLARALPRVETLVATPRQRLDGAVTRLAAALGLAVSAKHRAFDRVAGRMQPATLRAGLMRQRDLLAARGDRLGQAILRRLERRGERLADLSARLAPALDRMLGDAARRGAEGRARLEGLSARLEAAPRARLQRLADRLEALDRTRATLGYQATLNRGYAVVRGDGAVVTSKVGAEKAVALEIEFRDGRLSLGGRAGKRGKGDGESGQGSLF